MNPARPPAVHLDDLAAPQFPAPIAEALAAVEPLAAGISFDPDGLCDEAAAETGRSDFGDGAFRRASRSSPRRSRPTVTSAPWAG